MRRLLLLLVTLVATVTATPLLLPVARPGPPGRRAAIRRR